ncbi:unnamed protein product [Phytophthora lilii]|uniref:Unnamed protein product n=1 Tax=Phytophthora lilii TaxID=2077276 RepID=A0A9W7D9J0_9STRA|nr:unnamed protein product [Phytophthora lilii]
MRRKLCTSARKVVIVIQCAIWYLAQVVTAECWIGASGKEICSSDPTGFRATWWFFFALLLFASAASGCYDADWGFCRSEDDAVKSRQADLLESGLQLDEKGLNASIVQPLLGMREADKMHQQPIPSPPKPVYRYL